MRRARQVIAAAAGIAVLLVVAHGNNLVPIEFEINCELPDKYVRKDEIPAHDTALALTGFVGDVLIQGPTAGRGGVAAAPPGASRGATTMPAPAGRGAPPLDPMQQRLVALKQDFARLMLGVFASSFPTYPLTFTYAAVGEAPEGKADILDVAGPAGFAARLLVQQATHLPVMLMWQQQTTEQRLTTRRSARSPTPSRRMA